MFWMCLLACIAVIRVSMSRVFSDAHTAASSNSFSLSSLLLQYWTRRCYSSCILHVAVLVSEDGNKGGSRCGITMDRQHQRHFREDPSAERWSWQQDPLIDRLFDHKDSATPQRTLTTTTTTATVPRYEMLHPSCVCLSPFPPLLSLSLSVCFLAHTHTGLRLGCISGTLSLPRYTRTRSVRDIYSRRNGSCPQPPQLQTTKM